MPLPSVLKGAKQCQVLTKRTKLRCKNPAAFGCKACRMHGAHRSRNTPKGKYHPQYKNGSETIEAKMLRSQKAAAIRYLADLGNHVGLFVEKIVLQGRPPAEYEKLDLNDPEELVKAIKRSQQD